MVGRELRSWGYLKSLQNRELRSYPKVSNHILVATDSPLDLCVPYLAGGSLLSGGSFTAECIMTSENELLKEKASKNGKFMEGQHEIQPALRSKTMKSSMVAIPVHQPGFHVR